MRFLHPDGSTVHLSYCASVHPAEDLEGVMRQLTEYAVPVRHRLRRERIGLGLWLAHEAVCELTADPVALAALRDRLDRCGLEVVTLNGCPYEGLSQQRVKYRVYRPDWSETARFDHTLDLARLLTALLPADVSDGTVSTLPLAWSTGFTESARRSALERLSTLAGRLDTLEEATGRSVRIGLEPEPGCAVETAVDAVEALTGEAAPPARRVGVCLDTAHLATGFEDPEAALDALWAAGVPVVKAQLATAVQADDPARAEDRAALGELSEPRFLHQTRALGRRGTAHTGSTGAVRPRSRGVTSRADDLDDALAPGALPTDVPWRSHFRVPLHTRPAPPLSATTEVLEAALGRLLDGPEPVTHHVEVETYTWDALPPELRPGNPARLADGIADELSVVREMLTGMGLKEMP